MAHCIADKVRGLVAAMIAVFAAMLLVPGTAFAAPMSGSVTINGLVPGDNVTLYKIVDIDINDQNVAVASWVDELAGDGLSLENWESYESDSDDAVAMANQIAKLVSDDTNAFTNPGSYTTYTGIVIDGGNSVTINNVESGQYLVVVSNESVARVYQDAIVTVQPADKDGDGKYESASGSATLKATEMTTGDGALVKKIDEDGTPVDSTNNFDFTKNVNFQITTLVPLYTNTAGRTYTVTDTMSDGLTLNQDSFEITLDGTALEKDDYTLTPTTNGFTLTLNQTGLAKVTKSSGAELVITFSADVEDNVTYAKQETNTAYLTFSTDSVSAKTDTTDNDQVTVTFYAVKFTKVGEKNGRLEALKGAVFQLLDSDGEEIDEITTEAGGLVTFDGLAEGTYTVHEATAPAGYAPIDDFTVTIAADGSVTLSGGMTGSTKNGLTTITGAVVDGQTPSSGQIIDPVSTISLPVTGGIGTIALTAVGVVIIAGAAAYIVRSRKQN